MPRIGAIDLLRTLLTLMLVAVSLWIAINGVLPAPRPGAANLVEREPADEITWRRTDKGWVVADEWITPQPAETAPAQPHIHPFTLLPLVVVISLLALVLDQPKRPEG
ncbi:MAG: hypothetical protein WDZ51_05330 [Pirellulaceae bacterium]